MQTNTTAVNFLNYYAKINNGVSDLLLEIFPILIKKDRLEWTRKQNESRTSINNDQLQVAGIV